MTGETSATLDPQPVAQPIPQPNPTTPEQGVLRPWPIIYPLPIFPPSVLLTLEKQDPLFKAVGRNPVKNNLIQCLMDDISTYTW